MYTVTNITTFFQDLCNEHFIFHIHKFHFMLIDIKLCVDIIMTTCQHTELWELVLQLVNMLVCFYSLSISINFLRAISHRAACWLLRLSHCQCVIVRNEIIEMFPSSSFPWTYFSTFMTCVECGVLFWLRLCVSKWAQHMLQCAYANQFVYLSGSWSARATLCVILALLTFLRRKMFYAFLSLFSLFFFFCSSSWSSSNTTTPQFINNVFIYHENLFWN